MLVEVLDQVLKTLVFVVSSVDILVSMTVERAFMGAFVTLFTRHMLSSSILVSSFYASKLM